ncbi:unnamed protein product [Colias eurytheme]|nr:unnamed protein product [Colias eurytheme]
MVRVRFGVTDRAAAARRPRGRRAVTALSPRCNIPCHINAPEQYAPMIMAIEHSGCEVSADIIKNKLMDMSSEFLREVFSTFGRLPESNSGCLTYSGQKLAQRYHTEDGFPGLLSAKSYWTDPPLKRYRRD